MRHFTRFAMAALMAIAMVAAPVEANSQSRHNSSSHSSASSHVSSGHSGSSVRSTSRSTGNATRNSGNATRHTGTASRGASAVSRHTGSNNGGPATHSAGPATHSAGPATHSAGPATHSAGPSRHITEGRPASSHFNPGPGNHPGGALPGRESHFMGRAPRHEHWGPEFHRPHPYGYRMHDLFDYHPFWWHGINYLIADGLYWRYIDDMYVLCRPPYGVVIDVDVVNPDPVIVYNEVETTPEGTVVSPLAELAARLGLTQSIVPDGTQYYYEDGVFYMLDTAGKYEVIVPPAGALVSELPEDYSMISLDGDEYYLVDSTVYRLTVADGVSCFEVVGQRP